MKKKGLLLAFFAVVILCSTSCRSSASSCGLADYHNNQTQKNFQQNSPIMNVMT